MLPDHALTTEDGFGGSIAKASQQKARNDLMARLTITAAIAAIAAYGAIVGATDHGRYVACLDVITYAQWCAQYAKGGIDTD